MSSIGSSWWSSQSAHSVSPAAAIPNEMSVTGLVQPLSGPSMSPYTSVVIPMIESSAPIGSSGASSGSRDFGSKMKPRTSAAITNGMFTRNTEPYQKWSMSQPLATDPMMAAAPTRLAQIA